MRLTKRGEIVFAISSIFTALVVAGAVILGAGFLLTHHQVTELDTCHRVAEGIECNWHWEAN